jgi:hypothetical protein
MRAVLALEGLLLRVLTPEMSSHVLYARVERVSRRESKLAGKERGERG